MTIAIVKNAERVLRVWRKVRLLTSAAKDVMGALPQQRQGVDAPREIFLEVRIGQSPSEAHEQEVVMSLSSAEKLPKGSHLAQPLIVGSPEDHRLGLNPEAMHVHDEAVVAIDQGRANIVKLHPGRGQEAKRLFE